MGDFSETEEFDLTEGHVVAVWREALARGWTGHEGTLLVDGRVASEFRAPGHGLGCRFEREGEVVGLHVYGHPASPVASFSLPIAPSAHVADLLDAVGRVLGRTIGIGNGP